MLNVVDGCIPSDLGTGASEEIEEERRLLYVAMTRAKDDLHLVVPQRFFTHGQHSQGDRHVYASRTRFIPEKLLGLFERESFAGLFVTHSVSEAAFLASRVLVMSPRPGRIVAEIAVPFSYPRPPELRFAPEFASVAGQISACLRGTST